MQSHGFWPQIIQEKIINEVERECLNLVRQDCSNINYYSNIHEKVENVNELINEDVRKKVKKLLGSIEIELMATELHVQYPYCANIPHHQDNFYHCTQYNKSLKVLVPLNKLDVSNGGLIFLDTNKNYPVQRHEPSFVNNFSSYIPSEIISDINSGQTEYSYKLGDASYHFINSIHFSRGNKTNLSSMFVVFRFNASDYIIDESARAVYESCYEKHIKNIRSL